jgi:hypothetical protein
MNEVWQWILSIGGFVLSLTFFVVSLVIINNKRRYADERYIELVSKTVEYYQNLQLKDDKFFPYFFDHAASVLPKWGKDGFNIDPITNLTLKKNYVYLKDRLLYIINERIVIHPPLIKIDNLDYIQIDNKIKTVSVLVSFSKKDSMLIDYKIKRTNKDNYSLELMSVKKGDEINEKSQQENIDSNN